MGKQWKQWKTLFSWASKITVNGDCSHGHLLLGKHLLLGRKAMTNLDSILKSRDISLPKRSVCYGFSSSQVLVWELDHREGWVPKNWHFQTVALEKTLESPLDSKGIKPVNPKGNQSWIFIGRTDAEVEAPILWPPNVKSQHIGKDPTHWKRPWGWERSRARHKEDDRAWDRWMASSTQWTRVWANWETVKDRDTQHASVHGVAKCQTGLSSWTTTKESNPVLYDNLEGWDGVRSGGEIQEGGAYGWFMLIYGRNQHSVVKQLSSN